MIQQSHDIVSMLGVADQYHAVDDVAEVNAFIPPMLSTRLFPLRESLYEKEPGYKARLSMSSSFLVYATTTKG